MADKTYLVVGLGNIGAEYAATRHNAGFIILDAWAQASNVVFSTRRYGDVAEIREKGRLFVLLKPSTYMNLSGQAVRYWMQELNIPIGRTIILCDDINLPFGTLRMRQAGSDGGHNGLKNIALLLESTGYARIRIGVGHDFQEGNQINFVLGQLSEADLTALQALACTIVSGIKSWAFVGAQKAMTELNTRKKVGEKEGESDKIAQNQQVN